MREIARNIHRIDIKSPGSVDTEVLLISDVHFDSKKCKRELLQKHFEEAKKKNAKILCFGDWFDVMGSNKDPRSKPSDIRPEYLKEGNYLDLVVRDSFEFISPYIDQFCFMSPGNHETAIIRNNETDPMSNLIYTLRLKHGEKVFKGGYSGWILFGFVIAKSKALYKIAYHHGHGGNAKRSKGVLDVDIDQALYPDADLIVKGHTHHKWHVPGAVRYRISHDGNKIYHDSQNHLRLGSYKDDVEDGFEGWAVEKGFGPLKPGGWWVTLKARRNGKEGINIETEVKEAT